MKRSLLLAAAALAAVALVAAGCGGTDEVPADAVAVVDGTTIPKAELDELIARAKTSYTAQKREFPKAGTARVPVAADAGGRVPRPADEYEQQAEKLGSTVSDADVDERIDKVKKQYFGERPGEVRRSSSRSRATRSTAFRDDVRAQLALREALRRQSPRTSRSPTPTSQKYYDAEQEQYTSPSRRAVRHILVKTKAEADKIYDAARGRRRLRGAREGEVARPGLEGPRRQAHDLARARRSRRSRRPRSRSRRTSSPARSRPSSATT